MKKYGLFFIGILVFQMIFINLLSINNIRPDFLILFVLYFSVNNGSLKGTLVGFGIGIIASVFDVGLQFGVLPLTYSIVGYLGGLLKSQHYKLMPIYFYSFCFLIIFTTFFIYIYFNNTYLIYNNFYQFSLMWLKTASYTALILGILQFILPLRHT